MRRGWWGAAPGLQQVLQVRDDQSLLILGLLCRGLQCLAEDLYSDKADMTLSLHLTYKVIYFTRLSPSHEKRKFY